ncbi:DUF423 domain-containing protein [Maribacter sp. 2307ULW6-5]|uniref:DUF423 domain-containing protein n=1 Tax=Maribacter sp. 2307ULW6-5 TaxID=3386275 RepID=UPI0039BCDCC5
MDKTIFIIAVILGVSAVVLGAFGAHGLEQLVSADKVKSFETGVRYQMYHAFFLFVVALVPHLSAGAKKWVCGCVCIGVLLFSVSIYGLALNQLTAFDFKKIAFVTPVGGLFMIAAWLLLGYHFVARERAATE